MPHFKVLARLAYALFAFLTIYILYLLFSTLSLLGFSVVFAKTCSQQEPQCKSVVFEWTNAGYQPASICRPDCQKEVLVIV